jgi:Secretion system C-terminal sorting domain
MRVLVLFLAFFVCTQISAQYISEIEYDVPGADIAGSEYVEVYFPDPINPANFSIIRINGNASSAGVVYTTPAFATITITTLTTGQPGFPGKIGVWTGVADCLQNGANDAVILYNTSTSSVVQAIAYEGNVTVSSTATPAAIASLVITSVGSDPGTAAGVSLVDNDGDGIFSLATTSVGALPIQLINFEAFSESNTVSLNFTTASESDNSHFEIERSTDGRTFNKVGEVKGAGTTSQEQRYSFVDEAPVKGTNYYRLKQVNFDGSFEFSKVVTARFGRSSSISVIPTLVYDQINVNLDAQSEEAGQWQIFDLSGREVLNGQIEAEQAGFSADLSNLTEGIYMVRVQMGTETYTERVQKL